MILDRARHMRSRLPRVNWKPDPRCALTHELLTETKIAPSLQPVLVTDDGLKANPEKMQTFSGLTKFIYKDKLMCPVFGWSSPVIPV